MEKVLSRYLEVVQQKMQGCWLGNKRMGAITEPLHGALREEGVWMVPPVGLHVLDPSGWGMVPQVATLGLICLHGIHLLQLI